MGIRLLLSIHYRVDHGDWLLHRIGMRLLWDGSATHLVCWHWAHIHRLLLSMGCCRCLSHHFVFRLRRGDSLGQIVSLSLWVWFLFFLMKLLLVFLIISYYDYDDNDAKNCSNYALSTLIWLSLIDRVLVVAIVSVVKIVAVSIVVYHKKHS